MIRALRPQDDAGVQTLYAFAFPDEDLTQLVRDVAATVDTAHFVAEQQGQIIGHICFSPCHVGPNPIALLGPLAIHPDHQKAGHGSALIKTGLSAMKDRAVQGVMVLGDPA
ncbi:GNAT family N-acetyltransferase [Nereida sp. MMG025]|uniref:GNAT family N-acetyltransferase n=1 Tax=Nereida sp. MMG025 TaxID=2909981 RepID=UPI001F2B16A8|nr:N-acetyltransferase [Nereida sp. MMG025]MCF6445043.1 N-acetyltransferase [Nereida sp. MMG025]